MLVVHYIYIRYILYMLIGIHVYFLAFPAICVTGKLTMVVEEADDYTKSFCYDLVFELSHLCMNALNISGCF